MVPLGDDFRWDTKKEIDAQFSNYFKLINFMNSNDDMKIQVCLVQHYDLSVLCFNFNEMI